MAVIGPRAICPKCEAKVLVEPDGKISVHDVKGKIATTCIGSRGNPK